ncbi:phosphoribosyltransferase-like protein [Maribacter sp. 2-571]|uniref:phosphoribosyltransferase-like protein n=1 Tax=Maribacter sp. 2-571 TaxID=3417569 RepID=UPI003D32CDBB
MSIEVNIDSITLDILTRRLKYLVSPMEILEWLNNFEKEQVSIAVDFLKRFTVYTSNDIEDIFHKELNEVLKGIPKGQKMVVHPIGKFGKSGSVMSYLLKKTNTFKNNPDKILLIPSSEELENLPDEYETLVLIDDFVGSGKTILDYWDSNLDGAEDSFDNIVFIGVAGMSFGLNKIKHLFNDVRIPSSNIYKKAFSSDASFFGYRSQSEHRQIAYDYGTQLTRPNTLKSGKINYPNALGFSNSQALVGFFYGCPNNSLPIFWQEKNSDDFKWKSLLPRFNHHKISKARDFRKSISFELSLLQEFGTSRLQKEFVTYEIKRGQRTFDSVSHIDFSLYAILKLKREGHSDFNICQKLGILQSDYEFYLKSGKKKGIFNKKYEISLKGLELYNDAKKCIKNSFKYHYEHIASHKVKDINYIPKTFNGKS